MVPLFEFASVQQQAFTPKRVSPLMLFREPEAEEGRKLQVPVCVSHSAQAEPQLFISEVPSRPTEEQSSSQRA